MPGNFRRFPATKVVAEKIPTFLSQTPNSALVKQTERSYYSARSKLVRRDLKN